MAKFCTKCGAPLDERSKFCSRCGSVVPAAATGSKAMYTEVPRRIATTTKPVAKKNKGTVIGLVVILLCIAFVIGFVILYSDKSPRDDGDMSGTAIGSVTDRDTAGDGTYDTDDITEGDSEEYPWTEPESESEYEPAIPSGNIKRTIMIYIVGSNLESGGGMATEDILEMVNADFDTRMNNVLVYAGGANYWQNDVISASDNTILLVGEDGADVIETMDAENMGKSATLTEFLEYSANNYPADQFSLILWNHGGGPVFGYGVDEIHNNDYLTLEELEDALEKSPFGKRNKLELVGFDACLMGSLECAWIFRDYAEYYVASQEVEPGWGWDYNFLSKIDRCKNGGDIGETIVDSYFDFYEDVFEMNPSQETEITLSCVKLSEIDDVEKQLCDLFETVNENVMRGKIQVVSRCRRNSKTFGKVGSNNEYDLVDLKHLSKLLASSYSSEADDLIDALEDYVVCSKSNVRNASGVSLYHPYGNMSLAGDAVRVLSGIEFGDKYTEYIENFVSAMNTGDSGSYRDFSKVMSTVAKDGQNVDLTLQLTDEQVETFAGAKFVVFKELTPDQTFSEETEYLIIHIGYDQTLSEDGVLSATYQGKSVFGKNETTGEYSEFPLPMNQIYENSTSDMYYFPCMFYDFSGESMDVKSVNWLMRIVEGTPKLLSAYETASDDDNPFPDKNLIDSEDYGIYEFVNSAVQFEETSDGNTEIVFTDSFYGFGYTKEEGFSLEMKEIDIDGGYYGAFIIDDIYGNRFTSKITPIGK